MMDLAFQWMTAHLLLNLLVVFAGSYCLATHAREPWRLGLATTLSGLLNVIFSVVNAWLIVEYAPEQLYLLFLPTSQFLMGLMAVTMGMVSSSSDDEL